MAIVLVVGLVLVLRYLTNSDFEDEHEHEDEYEKKGRTRF